MLANRFMLLLLLLGIIPANANDLSNYDLPADLTTKDGALFYAEQLADCASAYQFIGQLTKAGNEDGSHSFWAGQSRGAEFSAKWLMGFTDYKTDYIDSKIKTKNAYWAEFLNAITNAKESQNPLVEELKAEVSDCANSYGDLQKVIVRAIKMQLYEKDQGELKN